MDAGKWAGEIGEQIGNNGQAAARKAQAVAIGIKNKFTDLGLSALNTALQKRFSTEGQKTFIPASHAFGEASGEDHACNQLVIICHGKLLLPHRNGDELHAMIIVWLCHQV